MNEEVIKAILDTYDNVTWVKGQVGNIPGEGWFLLEVSPLPPREELFLVASDIIENRTLHVRQGKVRHKAECDSEHLLPANLHKSLTGLKQRKFTVAIHPGIPGVYLGQPLAIPIDPIINYDVFPDHPHLNMGGPNEKGLFFPDTLCYEEDIARMYEDPFIRLKQSIALITVWLLRHMLWEETRRQYKKGVWIGPEAEGIESYFYLTALNPAGHCRCRSSLTYRQCHYPLDLQDARNKTMSFLSNEAVLAKENEIHHRSHNWKQLRQMPQHLIYQQLDKLFHQAK
jgi:hypothetical protein